MSKVAFIIDGLNQFLRNYIVLPHIGYNGDPIGGIVGMLRVLQALARKYDPDLFVIAWDGIDGGKRRRQMYPGYKDGRKALKANYEVEMTEKEAEENRIWQQLRTIEYLNHLPVHQLMLDEIEADDVISLVVQDDQHLSGWKKIIVSSDKDFYQLVSDDVALLRPNVKIIKDEDGNTRREDEFLTLDGVIDKFGIHPINFAIARAYEGDNSDNIEGVRGIGAKTLLRYVPDLGGPEELSVDDVVRAAEEAQEKRKKPLKTLARIIEGREVAQKNYRLMQLYEPLISAERQESVADGLFGSSPHIHESQLRIMMSKDGISIADFESLLEHFSRQRKNALVLE